MNASFTPEHDRPASRPQPRTSRFAQRYGPWAVVTGASSGIGAAIAGAAARRGLNVVLVARSDERLASASLGIEARYGVETRVVPLDLATADTSELMGATADLDVGLLVAAAGFGTSGTFIDGDLDVELEMLRLNCVAVCAQAHEFGHRMAQRGRGGIVLLSSILAYQGAPASANYAATKAYVHVLGEGLATELKTVGVDVLTAAPGPTATGFAERAGMAMGSASDPERLADPILDTLGRRPVTLPGARAKLLRSAVVTLPRRGRVKVMGSIMGSMSNRDGAH